MATNYNKYLEDDDVLMTAAKSPAVNNTDDYGNTDYSKLLNEAMDSGASATGVQKLLDQRVEKATSTPGLEQYAHDDVYNRAMEYINGQKAPAYTQPAQSVYAGKYDSSIDAVINQILNREPFSYDAASDPMYQQYAKQYRREGERSMQDVLAEVAGQTGGLASSYATTAASQARDYYGGKLADVIPQLQQLAYEKYMGEQDAKVRDLGLLQSLDASLYGRYRDAVGDWQDERKFVYGQQRDLVDDTQWQAEHGLRREDTEHGWQQDELNRVERGDDRQYNRSQNEQANALDMAATRAKYGDFSGYKALGYDTTQMEKVWQQDRAAQLAPKTEPKPEPGGDYDGLYQAAMESGNPQSFIANNYKKYGFPSGTGLYNDYKTWAEDYFNPLKNVPDNRRIESAARNASTMRSGGKSPLDIYNSLKAQGYDDRTIDEAFVLLGL